MKVVTLDESALEQGIDLFNRGEYFDAHEAWEGVWFRAQDAREKLFYQGLIMAAGAFVHVVSDGDFGDDSDGGVPV